MILSNWLKESSECKVRWKMTIQFLISASVFSQIWPKLNAEKTSGLFATNMDYMKVNVILWENCSDKTASNAKFLTNLRSKYRNQVEKLTKAYQRVERFIKVKVTVFIVGAYITLAKQNNTTLSLFDDELYFRKTVQIKLGKPDTENALVCQNGDLWSSQRSEHRLMQRSLFERPVEVLL